MPFNLLLLPLLGGYIFLTRFNVTKFQAKRYEGYKLLIESSICGTIILVISLFIEQCIKLKYPIILNFWYSILDIEYSFQAVTSFLLGSLSWIPLNFLGLKINFLNDKNNAEITTQKNKDYLEILFLKATKETKLISITLKNNKVYIGFIIDTVDPSIDRKYINIFPISSGYRNTENKKMIITTDYSNAYQTLEDLENINIDVQDLTIIFPLTEIQSVNIFNPELYNHFNSIDE